MFYKNPELQQFLLKPKLFNSLGLDKFHCEFSIMDILNYFHFYTNIFFNNLGDIIHFLFVLRFSNRMKLVLGRIYICTYKGVIYHFRIQKVPANYLKLYIENRNYVFSSYYIFRRVSEFGTVAYYFFKEFAKHYLRPFINSKTFTLLHELPRYLFLYYKISFIGIVLLLSAEMKKMC